MGKLVSIITPTYNHEKFIEECIQSVLVQTYKNWEMIIIDDGSIDNTESIVRNYPDGRIKYVRQANKGINNLSATYNKALSLAQGDFIAILEGDDYWPHYKLQLQVEDFKDDEVVLSFGYTQELSDDGISSQLIPTSLLPLEALTNKPVGRASLYMMDLNILTFLYPVSVMIRKDALEKVGGFHQPPYLPLVDYPSFLKLTLAGKFAFHNEILGFWRRHGRSITQKNNYLIHEGVYRYISAFLEENRARIPLSPEEILAIETQWKQYRWSVWFLLGRWFLVDGEWAKARKAFRKGNQLNNNWKQRILLQLCTFLSFFHCNVELLTRLLHLPHVKTVINDMNRKDLTISKDLLDQESDPIQSI